MVVVTGEVTLPIGVSLLIRSTIIDGIQNAGYTDPSYPFYPTPETVIVAVNQQSKAIANEVDKGKSSDQGAIVGFATQGPKYLLLAVNIAQDLTHRQFEL